MLQGPETMLIERLSKYLHDTLDIELSIQKWEGGALLPFFLQDNYVYSVARIYGLELLLMAETGNEFSPAAVQKHIQQVRNRWSGEVVYVREQISSFERKRLIAAGVPFIVPGNQLYLPMLALDLREYFRQPKQKNIHLFSPATQALALYWIYNFPGRVLKARKTPTEMAGILGYSKMTMSRAFKEIEAALEDVTAPGKPGDVQKYDLSGHQFWQRLQPHWRSPVKRRCYLLMRNLDDTLGLRAGLTALSAYSMLAEPGRDVYAVGQNEWKILQQRRDIALLDRPDTEAVEVEVWGYRPDLLANYGRDGTVDPLSLYLSLKDNRDERVEKALEDLLGGIQW